jgi:hypothetical protein
MTPHTASPSLAGPPSTGVAALGARTPAPAAPPRASVPGTRPRGRPRRKRSAGGDSSTSPGVVPALTGAAGVTLAATATSGWGVLEPLFTTTVATAVLTSVVVTAWPALSPQGKAPPRRRRAQQRLPPAPEDDVDSDLVYGAASVVSCIPFTNWVAWAGLALLADNDKEKKSSGQEQAEARAGRYAAFAVVYALPYLHCGLELDSLAVFSLLVGIAHMQLEFALQRGDGGNGGNGGDDLQSSINDWLSAWTQPPNSRQMQLPRKALGPPQAQPAPARRSASETPDAALEAGSRSSSPSVARQLGERVGELTAQLATLRTDFAAGKADGQQRVSLLAQEQVAQAELEALRAASCDEMSQWDDLYRLRAATRVQLLQLARSQRIVGASRLSKRELVDALEASMVVHGPLQQGEEGRADVRGRPAE